MKDLKGFSKIFLIAAIASICGLPLAIMSQNTNSGGDARNFDGVIQRNVRQFMDQGRQIFRFDTFGDEAFWGDNLKLHQAIAGSKFGGVGAGVSPRTARATLDLTRGRTHGRLSSYDLCRGFAPRLS